MKVSDLKDLTKIYERKHEYVLVYEPYGPENISHCVYVQSFSRTTETFHCMNSWNQTDPVPEIPMKRVVTVSRVDCIVQGLEYTFLHMIQAITECVKNGLAKGIWTKEKVVVDQKDILSELQDIRKGKGKSPESMPGTVFKILALHPDAELTIEISGVTKINQNTHVVDPTTSEYVMLLENEDGEEFCEYVQNHSPGSKLLYSDRYEKRHDDDVKYVCKVDCIVKVDTNI